MRYALVAAAVILIILAAVLYYGETILDKFFPSEQSPVTQEVGGEEIAHGIAGFLMRSLRENGTFTQYYQCVRDGGCVARESDPAFTGHATAYLLLYSEAFDSAAHRKAADDSMRVIMAECTRAAVRCANFFFAIETYYDATKDEQYRTAMLRAGEPILNMVQKNGADILVDIVSPNNGHKLARLYAESGDKRYLDALNVLATRVINEGFDMLGGRTLYTEGATEVNSDAPNLASRILVPAYIATKNDVYLEAIQEVFIEGAIGKNADRLRSVRFPFDTMWRVTESLIDLQKTLSPMQQRQYKDQTDALMAYIAQYEFDSEKRPIFDGANDFVTGRTPLMSLPEGVSFLQTNFKGARENGHIGYLLINGGYLSESFQLEPLTEEN